MANGHARLAPSAAKRWMACPGSVRLTAHLPDTASEYAELGTAAHLLFEMCMRLDDAPEAWLGRTIGPLKHVVDADMADAVGHACDYVRGYLVTHPTAEWHPERTVNAGRVFGREDCWGTADTIIDNRADRELIVLDYKHGAGVYVDVVDNEQLSIYLIGAMTEELLRLEPYPYDVPLPWDKFTMVIAQPRVFGVGGPVRPITITLDEIVEFGKKLRIAAAATDAPDAPLVAGEHCRFCKASPRCPALAQHALTVAQQEFTVIADHKQVTPHIPLEALDLDDFAYVLSQVPAIKAWCNSVEAAAEAFVMRDGHIPGQKVVAGRASYVWADVSQVTPVLVQQLGDKAFSVPELISPAQAKKLLGGGRKKDTPYKTLVAPLVRKVPGKLTMAPTDDPREAVNPIGQDFENLDVAELLE